MTLTERLRALLDERGVEWREPPRYGEYRGTVFSVGTEHGSLCFEALDEDGMLTVCAEFNEPLTPEQAVEATLGRGTLEAENARLRDCLAASEEEARVVLAENRKLRELVRHLREELKQWHQRYEGEKSMEKKGITEELRECMRTATRFYEDMSNPYNDRERLSIAEEELTAIADRIDDQHDAELQAEYINGYHKALEEVKDGYIEYINGYHKALEEVKDGYIKLPVDADGVPIKLGDELTDGANLPAKVGALLLDSGGWWCKSVKSGACVTPSTLRHVQPDSWERIINDAMFAAQGHLDDKDVCAELVERCRRLADDL